MAIASLIPGCAYQIYENGCEEVYNEVEKLEAQIYLVTLYKS